MKECKNCHNLANNEHNFCSKCGCNEFIDYSVKNRIEQYYIDKSSNFKFASNHEKEWYAENPEIIQERKQNNKKNFLVKVIAPFALSILFLFVGFSLPLFFFAIPVSLSMGVHGIIAALNTCPNCKTWNGLEEINKTETSRYNTTIKEKRTAKAYELDKSNRRTGNAPFEIEYDVDVDAVKIHYDVECKCKYCGYTTIRQTSSTYKK